jgi:hypothetical protein
LDTFLGAIGVVLAVIGLLFAFATPRKWFVDLFRRKPDVTQDLRIEFSFHGNRPERSRGSSGKVPIDRSFFLYWDVRNETDMPIQIERGMLYKRGLEVSPPVVLITEPEQSNDTTILPHHRVRLLYIDLIPKRLSEFRSHFRNCKAFGLKLSDGREFWIDRDLFVMVGSTLEMIARDYGLEHDL